MKIYIIVMVLFALGYAAVWTATTDELRRYIGPRFVISYSLVLLIAMLTSSIQIYYLAIIFLFVVTVSDRVDAICRYILFSLLLPSIGWPIEVNGTYLLETSSLDATSVAFLLSALIHKRPRAPKVRRVAIEDGLILILVLIFWLGVTRFPSFTAFLRGGTTQIIGTVLPYLLLRNQVRSVREYRLIIAMIAVSAAILTVYALYETFAGWSIFQPMRASLSIRHVFSTMIFQRGGVLRATGSMAGPLVLAIVLVFGVMATMASRDYIRSRLLWVLWIGATIVGLLTTQSRSGIASLAITLFVFLMLRRKYALALSFGGAGAAIGTIVLLAASKSATIAAFLNLGGAAATGHYDYRGLLLERGLQEALRNPWLGQAHATMIERLADIKQGQDIVDIVNTYLYFFLVSGLVGLGAFAIVACGILAKLLGGYRKLRDEQTIGVRAFCGAGFIYLLIQLTVMSVIDRVTLMIVLMLAGLRLAHVEYRRIRVGRDAKGPARPLAPS